MKKFSVTVLLVLTFFSCDTKYYTVTADNQSSKTVTYAYNGAVRTLSPNSSELYRVEAYTLPPEGISVLAGAMSVKMESHASGERYVFRDITPLVDGIPFELQVTNNLNVAVELRAAKSINDTLEYEYIECTKPDGSLATELTIPAGSNTHDPAKIYTISPNFTVALYSPTITWKFEDNIMKVVIEK
ncbi:MAG: hypothetical protein LBG07_00885 [Treponema sp.]|jgi:hypothetical protein|nr:hypothetical protein [Treponema sp.]